MKSSGSKMTCVVPSRYGVFSWVALAHPCARDTCESIHVVADVAVRRERQALFRNRRPADVPTQSLEFLALIRPRCYAGVQRELPKMQPGCDVSGAATATAVQRTGARGRSAPAIPSSGRFERSDATHRRLASRSDDRPQIPARMTREYRPPKRRFILTMRTARFQARSAFTGAGFTTAESEKVFGHPLRRRIVMLLMLLGNAGIITAVSSLILTFVGRHGILSMGYKIVLLVTMVVVLWAVSVSKWVDRRLSHLIERALKRYTRLDVHD